MKALLEYFFNDFDVLYLDPQYRITNPSSRGYPTIDASIQLTGPILSWNLVNNRGQMELTVAPTRLATAENWFWVSQIKQYVDGESEIKYLSAAEEIEWVRGNIDRVERVLADGLTLETTCEELQARARAVSWSQCG